MKRLLAIMAVPGVVLLVAAVWVLVPRGPHPAAELFAEKGELRVATMIDQALTRGTITEELELTSTSGLSVRVLVQSPPKTAERHPAILLLGGLRTGRTAILHIPELSEPVVWISIDYLYQPPHAFPDAGSVLDALPDAERGVVQTLSAITLTMDYLESRPDVDPSRTILAGGSLGAFLAVVGGALDPRFEAVACLYGGGNLEKLVETNLPWESPTARGLVARGLNPWLSAYDPLRFVDRIAPRPFLMVNGTLDTRIPKECVLELYERAGEPKELVWMETGHRIQDEDELMTQATGLVLDWLRRANFFEEAAITRNQ